VTWQAFCAVFATSTASLSASISAGSLCLTDDAAAMRLFTATGLRSGVTETRCIAVTSSGSPATVRLYGTGRSSLALASGIGMSMSTVIFDVVRREETAADATAAEVFSEVLTVAGVQRLRRREGAFGAFAELPLSAVRTHPRPSHRCRAGLARCPQSSR